MEREKIKISVMIPVYNTSRYLEKCLTSVLEQSLKEIEIICVNDGSTDNSLEVLKKYQKKDNRIKIVNKSNGGLTSARNEALKLATGEYSLNVDSDDWIKEKYLEDIYNEAKKNDLDILITDIVYAKENKREEYETYIRQDLNLLDGKIISGKEYIDIFFENNFLGYTWNKLIKTELYKSYGLKYNETIFFFEDVELILRLSYFCKKIGKLNKAYYFYRQGENNGIRKVKLKNLIDLIECFDSLIKFYKTKEVKIMNELIQIKKLFYTSEVLSDKYNSFGEYKKILNKYFDYIKDEKFITKKFTCNNKGLFGKKERLFLCVSYNLIKIFPKFIVIRMLISLRNILRG